MKIQENAAATVYQEFELEFVRRHTYYSDTDYLNIHEFCHAAA